jgi:hypothetical protein
MPKIKNLNHEEHPELNKRTHLKNRDSAHYLQKKMPKVTKFKR